MPNFELGGERGMFTEHLKGTLKNRAPHRNRHPDVGPPQLALLSDPGGKKVEKDVYRPVEGPQSFWVRNKQFDKMKGEAIVVSVSRGKEEYKTGQVVDILSDSGLRAKAEIVKIEPSDAKTKFKLTLKYVPESAGEQQPEN